MKATILQGHVLDRLREMPDESVQCVVTSPPYWGLRDYGIPPSIWGGDPDCPHEWLTEEIEREMRRGLGLKDSKANTRGGAKKCAEVGTQCIERGQCLRCGAWLGCFGSEPTPEMYVEHATMIFREVRRVLRKDGICWVNLGDSYANPSQSGGGDPTIGIRNLGGARQPKLGVPSGLKPKDLVGIPWRVAFALQAAGWWLRQDIIWSKPNPMPESVSDRCTKAHEYLFLLTKSARYYYDQEAILEPVSANTHARLSQDIEAQIGSERANGGQKTNGNMKAVGRLPDIYKGSLPGRKDGPGQDRRGNGERGRKLAEPGSGTKNNASFDAAMAVMPEKRNKRSVWEIATQAYSEAHFATFPEKLVEPCVLAGSKPGEIVLDPFTGSGTTGVVALRYHRQFIGIELNPEYISLAERRISSDAPLLNEIVLDGVPV